MDTPNLARRLLRANLAPREADIAQALDCHTQAFQVVAAQARH